MSMMNIRQKVLMRGDLSDFLHIRPIVRIASHSEPMLMYDVCPKTHQGLSASRSP